MINKLKFTAALGLLLAVSVSWPQESQSATRTKKVSLPTYTLKLSGVPKYPAQDLLHAQTQYPRRAVYFLTSTISDDQAVQIARWDYAILAMENQYTNPEALRKIKQLNPSIRLAFYFASNEANRNSLTDPSGSLHALAPVLDMDEDFLYDHNGEVVTFWPGTMTYNLPNPATRAKLVTFLRTAPDYTLWDDVFIDNIWNDVSKSDWVNRGVDVNRDGLADNVYQFSRLWVNSTLSLVHDVRVASPASVRLIGNIGGENVAMQDLNGRMFEGFPNTLGSLWQYRRNYLDQTTWRQPVTNIVHAEGNQGDVDKVRRGLAFTLLGDGYFAFDHGPNASAAEGDTGWHDVLWWYEAEYQSVGRALTNKISIGSSGLIAREFDRIVVLYNTTTTTKKVKVVLRNGRTTTVTVGPEAGYFLSK